MAAELLKTMTGINVVHVPYKGSTSMRVDVLSGQIQMLFDSIPTMAPYVKADEVRALGTSGLTRDTRENSVKLENFPAGKIDWSKVPAVVQRRDWHRHGSHCQSG
jgi:tripartite-type tricarboxylate transporter receptor subunit TctC